MKILASGLLSVAKRVRSHISFEAFTLNCCFPETLSEVVLGTVSSAMAAVTDDGNDHLPIFLVVSKNLLEPVAQVVEVNVLADLRLKDAWLHLRGSARARESLVEAVATRLILKEVARGGSRVKHIQSRLVIFHCRL